MIIPSIDIEGGQTVQLIGGERRALELGDPLAVIERFRRVGEVAVIDLDAARDGASAADNRSVIEVLCERAACRVGGGIRDHETAVRWLDRGAAKIIVGTAATPTLLRRLPKERVIVALDAFEGEVVTHGWRTRSGRRVEKVMAELRGLAGGFLFTLVEREGRLGGMDFERARTLVELSGDAAVTVAGGIVDAAEIAALDRMGADAQVGMALYTGRVPLADALAAPLTSDRPDGLWPTVVVDEGNHLLGLAWSDLASLGEALQSGRGVYRSRRRGLWTKGETSGATQELLRVDLDCDRDALRFTVRQAAPGFCHTMRRSCFGDARGLDGLARLVAAEAGQHFEQLSAIFSGVADLKKVFEAARPRRRHLPAVLRPRRHGDRPRRSAERRQADGRPRRARAGRLHDHAGRQLLPRRLGSGLSLHPVQHRERLPG